MPFTPINAGNNAGNAMQSALPTPGFTPLDLNGGTATTAQSGTPKTTPSFWNNLKTGISNIFNGSGGQAVGKEQLAGGQDILSGISEGAQDIQKGINAQNPEDLLNIPTGFFKAGWGSLVGAGRTFFAPITAAMQGGADITGIHPLDALMSTGNKTVTDNNGNQIPNPDYNLFMENLQTRIKQNPEVASAIGTFVNGLLTLAGAKGFDIMPELKAPVSSTVGKSGDALSAIAKTAKTQIASAGEKTISLAGQIKNKVSDLTGWGQPKTASLTAEQILATPKEQVPNLNAQEQSLWYKNDAKQTQLAAQEKIAVAKMAGDKAVAQSETEMRNLTQELGNATREKVISLKEPVRQAFKSASQTYLELSGEAADKSPNLNKTISVEDINAKIDKEFADVVNEQTGVVIKDQSAIRNSLKQTLGEGQSSFTNQQILDKARGIMADEVNKSSKAGNTSYSFGEYQAIKKYGFLMDILKENGVDMGKANEFWKNYKQFSDRAIKEIKPFDETNLQKMPFEKTIQRAVSPVKNVGQVTGKLDAQNFISEIETRANLPKGSITKEAADISGQIEKAKLTRQQTENAIQKAVDQIKKEKLDLSIKMDNEKYNNSLKADEKARLKKQISEKQARVRKIIYWTVGLGAAKVTGLDQKVLEGVKAVL